MISSAEDERESEAAALEEAAEEDEEDEEDDEEELEKGAEAEAVGKALLKKKGINQKFSNAKAHTCLFSPKLQVEVAT